jgi:hypothetical protein
MKIQFLVIILLGTSSLNGQNPKWLNKYSIGIEVAIGHSFPDFDKEQERWIGTFYPAGAISLVLSNRINKNWIIDGGVGLTGYALNNKGPKDKYILDFASPSLSTGVSYNFKNYSGREFFAKMSIGGQLGYRGNFVDVYDAYQVEVRGNEVVYPFIRPEIGFRHYLKNRNKGSRYKTALEIGTYFRYNLNRLGVVTIQEPDFKLVLEPSGNIIGTYCRVLFPTGNKRVNMERNTKSVIPPIIYNPRFF